MNEDVIDTIYEASAIPELWPDALDKICSITNSFGGVLFATDMQNTKWITSKSLNDLFERFINEGWMSKNPRPVRLAAQKYAGFISDADIFTKEELDNEPVYTEVYRKIGIGWAAGTMFPMPSGDNMVFSFERAYDLGPVDAGSIEILDALRPHLARASLLTWRLGMRNAKAMADVLEIMGLPAAVLRGAGRIQAMNSAFEALIPKCFQDRRERLVLNNRKADELLSEVILRLSKASKSVGIQSVPVPATPEFPAMVVHLLPVRRQAQDIFSQASVIVIAMPVDKGRVPSAELLEALFDLTATEASVARAVGEGRDLNSIARDRCVSIDTVRTQMKAVLAKTGTGRQAELASLLGGLVFPNTNDPHV